MGLGERIFGGAASCEAVEPENSLLAAVRNEADAMGLAGFEADGRAGGDVESAAKGSRAVEAESGVGLEKVVVGAYLHCAVAGVDDVKLDDVAAGVDFDVAIAVQDGTGREWGVGGSAHGMG